MTSGTCSLSARFQSLVRARFISIKMNSRLSMVKDGHMTRYKIVRWSKLDKFGQLKLLER